MLRRASAAGSRASRAASVAEADEPAGQAALGGADGGDLGAELGLPEEIGHICMGHSLEGAHIGHSTECYIIRQADHAWWHVAAALDLCHPETIGFAGPNLRVRPIGMQ